MKTNKILDVKSKQYLGSLPGNSATGCCCFGTAELTCDKKVMITWGRNLSYRDAKWIINNTKNDVVKTSSSGFYEVIIPEEVEQILKPILVMLPEGEMI